MDLSYDELRRIYRLEKNTSRLVDVEEDFYDSLSLFVQASKKEYLASLKDVSSSKARNFANLKKIVEEIFALREKKLIMRALLASRNGEEINERLASLEKKTFKELLAVLNKHRGFLMQAFEPEKRKSAENVERSIKLLKEVPAFVGPDMKEYGPFSVDQTVLVPFKVAELLVARKLAEDQK